MDFAPQRRRRTALRWALPLAVVLASAGPAHAGSVAQDLDAAEKAYVDLDYDKANKLADGIAKQRGLTHDQLIRAYRLLARTHAVLDHEAAARDAFVLLLTYSPDEKEDRNLPPKVTDRIMEARGQLAGYGGKPGIEVATTLKANTAGLLKVTTRDPMHIVKKLVVGYRWGSSGSFVTSNVAVGDAVAVDVPTSPANVTRLDYYAQAFDDRDDSVFEVGNPTAPKTSVVDTSAAVAGGGAYAGGGSTQEGGKSIFASPVFWIIAGAVVAGGAAGAFFGLRKKDDTTLPPTSAGISPVLLCGPDKAPCR